MAEPTLTPYQLIKLQMEYAVPLIRDLQAILGEETVNKALEQRLQNRIEKAKGKARTDIPAAQRAAAATKDFARFADGDVLDYETIATDRDVDIAVNVNSCGYTKFMQEMNATDLGHLLICSEDHVIGGYAGMELTRTQTRMQGAKFCDFRYKVLTD